MTSDVSSDDVSSGGGTATRAPEPDTGFDQRRTESLGLRIQHVLHARPILGPLAVLLLSIIAFSIITETVFQWPGMGLLFLKAVQNADVPIMSAYLLLVGFIFVVINLIVDLLYLVVDPRVRIETRMA